MAQPRYPFTPRVLMYAPAAPGRYSLWNGDALIHSAELAAPATIQGRLMDHYCGRAEPSRATHCAWEALACAELD